MDRLSGFAELFRAQLGLKHPALAASATLIPQDGGPDHGLRIEVPPATSSTSPMTIEAVDEEVMVSFDLWHMDYTVGPYEAATVAEAIDEAVSIIEGILAERTAIFLSARDDDHCVMAGTFSVADGPPEEKYYRLCVRSWRGTYDMGWCLPWPVWE